MLVTIEVLDFNYSISSANTWSRVVIPIPGDTTGTWNKGDSVGIKIIFLWESVLILQQLTLTLGLLLK